MDTDFDMKHLWSQQNVPQSNLEDILNRVKKMRRNRVRKVVFVNLALIITAVFVTWVWVYYKPQLIITKIGIVSVVFAMVMFLVSYNRVYKWYNVSNNNQTTSDQVKNLITIKRQEKFIHGIIMCLYFLFLSVGLALYLYEYTLRMPEMVRIITYIITFAWIGFNWFYIRPRQINKQQKQLDELIEQFEIIENQFRS